MPSRVRTNTAIFNLEPTSGLLLCRAAKHGTTTWNDHFLQIYTEGAGAGPGYVTDQAPPHITSPMNLSYFSFLDKRRCL